MDGQFFSSWDWWQKLIFILACSVVLIIMTGFIALSITKRRMRKYATLRNQNKLSSKDYSVEDPEMSLGSKTFEGQAPNKGVQSYSPRIPSFTVPAMSKQSFSSHYDDPKLQSSENSDNGSQLNIQYSRLDRNPEYEIGRAISTDVAEESINVTRPSIPKLHRSRSTRSPSFRTLHVLDEEDESYDDQSFTTDDRDSLPSAHMFQTTQKTNRPSHTKLQRQTKEADLSLLNNHRLSHVAETGQLTPKDRRCLGKVPSSNTFSSIETDSVQSCSSIPDSTYILPKDSRLTACGSSSESSKSSDSVINKTNDTHSPYMKLNNGKMYCLPNVNVSDLEVIDLRKENITEKYFSTSKDASPVEGRKVNSGFEVLAQGTFAKQKSKHGSEKERKHHKKQQQNKGPSDLNNRLLRKLRKSVSKQFS